MAPERIAGDGSRRRHEREEAAGGGGLEARSRVLADRLRRGVIRREHLSVAGWLEDPAARRMVEAWVTVLPLPKGSHPVNHALFRGPIEHRVLVWLASDFAARVLTRFETVCPGDTRPRRAIEAARAWAACPCEEHRAAADHAAVVAHIAGVGTRDLEAVDGPAADWAAGAAADAARVAAADAADDARSAAAGAAISAAHAARAAADADFCVLVLEGLERHVAAAERAAAGRAGAEAERAWQRYHMIAVLTGDVTDPLPLTPPHP